MGHVTRKLESSVQLSGFPLPLQPEVNTATGIRISGIYINSF